MKKSSSILTVCIIFVVLISGCSQINPSNYKENKLSSYVSDRNLTGLILPLRYTDMTYNHTGFWPFGVQGGSHAHGHPGFDFEASVDKPMIAVDDGRVREINIMSEFEEQYIVVDSGTFPDYEIYYTGPIIDFRVKEGDIIRQGDVIAFFGASDDNGILPVGVLHFEIHRKYIQEGGAVCPYDFMTPEAKQQLEEIFNEVNSRRGNEVYPMICIPCPNTGCY